MEKKQEDNGKVRAYLLIVAGVCLVAIRFISDMKVWSIIDFIKLGVGVVMIGFGIYQLIKPQPK